MGKELSEEDMKTGYITLVVREPVGTGGRYATNHMDIWYIL